MLGEGLHDARRAEHGALTLTLTLTHTLTLTLTLTLTCMMRAEPNMEPSAVERHAAATPG